MIEFEMLKVPGLSLIDRSLVPLVGRLWLCPCPIEFLYKPNIDIQYFTILSSALFRVGLITILR